MTNKQVENVQVGDYIDHHINGRVINMEVKAVRTVGVCSNPAAGAFGQSYACLDLQYTGSKLVVGTSIHSDDYGNGSGYPTHDAEQNRISGWQLVGHNAIA